MLTGSVCLGLSFSKLYENLFTGPFTSSSMIALLFTSKVVHSSNLPEYRFYNCIFRTSIPNLQVALLVFCYYKPISLFLPITSFFACKYNKESLFDGINDQQLYYSAQSWLSIIKVTRQQFYGMLAGSVILGLVQTFIFWGFLLLLYPIIKLTTLPFSTTVFITGVWWA